MLRGSYPFLLLAVGMGVLIVCTLLFGAAFFFMNRDFQKTKHAFLHRHLEATNTINQTYAYFKRQGHWPVKNDFGTPRLQSLPNGWDFEGNPAYGGPVIWTHGPYHMILSYRFEPPSQDNRVNLEWTLSIEGDKVMFHADTIYSQKLP